jgi:dynein assembly factor 3, axonemal
MEIYLDLFANCLIRDKTSAYLEETARELIALVTEDEKKCKSVLKEVINFETLKFKDRDDLEEIFSSYLTCHKFDIETLRDHRMRGHFKERYDHRRNLVDWDYNMNMKDYAPYVNQLEYRKWRLTGIGFETRLATGSIPNRTLGSFVPGKNRKTKDNILIRGFWGDIINSPYLCFGQEVWEQEARTRFFKKVNYQSVYSNADVSEYNVQAYIHKMEDMEMYEHGFEKLKHILGDDYYDPKTKEKMRKEREAKKKEEEEKKKLENIEEEPMIEEVTDDQAEQIEKKQEEEKAAASKKPKSGKDVADDLNKALNTKPKSINLAEIDEGNREVKPENEGTRKLLKGMEFANVKFHLLTDSIDKLYTKSKYKDLFDIGVLSIHSANKIDSEFLGLFKDGAKLHVESADYIVIMNK